MTDNLDTAALRRVAEAATQENWIASLIAGYSVGFEIPAKSYADWVQIAECENEDDAEHVAAFQPRVALQLLARIEALEAVAKNIRMNLGGDITALTAEQARWKLEVLRKLLGDDA